MKKKLAKTFKNILKVGQIKTISLGFRESIKAYTQFLLNSQLKSQKVNCITLSCYKRIFRSWTMSSPRRDGRLSRKRKHSVVAPVLFYHASLKPFSLANSHAISTFQQLIMYNLHYFLYTRTSFLICKFYIATCHEIQKGRINE